MAHNAKGKLLGKCKSVFKCISATAILFCFGLYALYKYTLIDVESVLHNGNAFNHGDYGIDVSALRSVKTHVDNEGNPVSKVDQWDALVRNEEGVGMAYITDNCDMPNDVHGVAYLAKNERGGLKVVVLVNYTAERDIGVGSGEAVIFAKYGKVMVLNQTLELCSVDEELLKCPIQKGFTSYRREVVLPRFAPKGKYHGIVNLRYIDTKEVQLCAKGMMIL